MSGKILITGATGQLGTHLLRALGAGDICTRVRALVRRDDAELPVEMHCVALSAVVDHPEVMEDVDCIIHLAAHVGKGSFAKHREVTVSGTASLLRAAESAGVKRFLFISSIAAGFEPRVLQPYPYAVAKREAEALLTASSLKTLILRPTLILGAGMSGHKALSSLACLPVTPLFGDAELQPIHVRDMATAIVHALESEAFDGRILDVGGPTRLTMSELLRRMRRFSTKGGEARLMRLPGTCIAMMLGALEPVLRLVLPLTAGQIQTFMQSGTAEANTLMDALDQSMMDLDETLAEVPNDG